MNSEKLAPNEEGVRACLRCGKPIRIVEGNGNEAFCVEVNPVELGAEYGVLVVKYGMHFENCKKESLLTFDATTERKADGITFESEETS